MSDGGEFTPQYAVGDTANGYVLTPQGWRPIPPGSQGAYGSQPTVPIGTGETTQANPRYQIGDLANGYVLTPQGWRPAAGQQAAYGLGAAGSPLGQIPSGPGPGPNRKGLYIALAIAVVVILGVAVAGTYAWATLRSNSVSAPKSPTPSSRSTSRTSAPTTRPTQSATPRPTAPRTTAPTTAPTRTAPTTATALQAQAFTYGHVGVLQATAGVAAELKVDKPVPFPPASEIDQPDRGQLVYVPVTVKVTGTAPMSIGDVDFVAVLPDGQRLDSALVVDLPKDAPAPLDERDVNPGETLTGSVAFDVPKDTPLEVGYQPGLQLLGTWSD